jgi:hypothetical protein
MSFHSPFVFFGIFYPFYFTGDIDFFPFGVEKISCYVEGVEPVVNEDGFAI